MARFSAVKRAELDEKLRPLIEGKSLQHHKVASLLGVSEDWVQRACKRMKLTTQRRGPRAGEKHPDWRGGRVEIKGYLFVYCPDHPSVKYGRYVAEHRLVMEQCIGRYLEPTEVVHHKDGNKLNNDPTNLELFASNAEHLKHELSGRIPNWTADGKKRISEGVKRAWTIRRKRKSDDDQQPQ